MASRAHGGQSQRRSMTLTMALPGSSLRGCEVRCCTSEKWVALDGGHGIVTVPQRLSTA
jgi:hypothetical protein